MRKLVIVLAILGALLAIVLAVGWWLDGKARALAEAEASKRIVEVLPGTSSATVEIGGFPFIVRVLLWGEVKRLDVKLAGVRQAGIEVEAIELGIDGLRIDRDLLINEQKLAVLGIERAEVVGRVTGAAVSKVLGEAVEFDGDVARVAVQGFKLDAKLSVAKRRVSLELSSKGVPPEIIERYVGRSMQFDLPGTEVLPCEPGLTVAKSRLEMRCSLTELPDGVKRALGQR